MKIDIIETFQVGAIIAKFRSTLNGYRKKLLNNTDDYYLEYLQEHLRIEEESRVRDKLKRGNLWTNSKANVVSKPNNSNKKNNGKKRTPTNRGGIEGERQT